MSQLPAGSAGANPQLPDERRDATAPANSQNHNAIVRRILRNAGYSSCLPDENLRL